jgi:hypothetical protein
VMLIIHNRRRGEGSQSQFLSSFLLHASPYLLGSHLYLAPPPRVLAAHGGTTKAEKKHDG